MASKSDAQLTQPAAQIHATREGWLMAALPLLYALAVGKMQQAGLEELEPTPLDKIKATAGFPSKGALRGKKQRIGEAWHGSAAADGSRQIIVSIVLHEPTRVLDILLHELIHALLPEDTGHKGPFRKLAKACGLEGKMTATVAGDELGLHLARLVKGLGTYPHVAFDPGAGGRKKQSTRLVKACCPDCGMIIRTTSKWIETTGLPVCACGADFEL